MFVYLKDNQIIFKSEEKRLIPGSTLIETDYKMTDNVIFENGAVILYENSERYKSDKHIEDLQKKAEKAERNAKRTANQYDKKIKTDWKVKAVNDYYRTMYSEVMRRQKQGRVRQSLDFLQKACLEHQERLAKPLPTKKRKKKGEQGHTPVAETGSKSLS